MIHFRISILFLFFLAFSYASAQEEEFKELKLELKKAKEDTSFISVYNEFSKYYIGQNDDSAVYFNNLSIAKVKSIKAYNFEAYYQRAYLLLRKEDMKAAKEAIEYTFVLARQNKNLEDVASSYHLYCIYCDANRDYRNALENGLKALKLREQFKDTVKIISSLNTIGQIYKNNQRNTEGLKFFLKSAQLSQLIGQTSSEFSAYINLGTLYERTQDYDKALRFYKKAIKINDIDKDPNGYAICYAKMGSSYGYASKFDSAFFYYLKTVQIHHLQKNDKGLMASFYKLAGTLTELGNFELSKKYLDSSFAISSKKNDSLFISYYYATTGLIEFKSKNYKMAIDMYKKGLSYFPFENDYLSKSSFYMRLSLSYKEIGEYKNALEFLTLHKSAMDSVSAQNDIKKQTELKLSYEFDQIQEQQKQEAKAKELENRLKLEAEKKQRNYLIGLLGLAVIVIIIAVRSFIAKKKSNFLLEKQNIQLEFQKKLVDIKNKEISDSINYAKHIQTACLPDEEQLNLCFSDYFLLFKPRDVVSGDFFWTAQTQDGKVLLAVADCTGHGVPGAIMSMIGSMLLNEIFYVKNISSPDDVLSELNRLVKLTLKQTNIGSSSRDGMDIAFCLWDNSTKRLSYSGANRPLYFISNDGTLNELKASKLPIGGNTELHQKYDLHELVLNSGDRIVLSSDGYADQFGGEKEKKINTKKFKEILLSNHSKNSHSIKSELNTYFEQWKGTHEQTDDVLVFSFKA